MEGKLPAWSHWIQTGNFSLVLLTVFPALQIWRFELKIWFIRRSMWRRDRSPAPFSFCEWIGAEAVAGEEWGRSTSSAVRGGLVSWLDSWPKVGWPYMSVLTPCFSPVICLSVSLLELLSHIWTREGTGFWEFRLLVSNLLLRLPAEACFLDLSPEELEMTSNLAFHFRILCL